MTTPNSELRAEGGYTPGPWSAWDRGIGWEVHGADGEAINSGFRETFSREDAALISAAPDLLAALIALRDELSGVDRWWGSLREAAEAADAAIAKAEGRQ